MDAAMLAPEQMARTEKPGACGQNATKVANGRGPRRGGGSAAGGGRYVGGHRVRVGAREELRRHAAVAGAADLDRVEHALLVEPAQLVQVRARHAVCGHGVERVAALAGLDEELLAVLQLPGHLFGAEAAGPAHGLAAGG